MAGDTKKGGCPPGSGRQTFLERTLGVIVREALCTYELDVTHEVVTSDIYSSDGVNMFEKWGLRAPVSFDDLLMVAVRNGLDDSDEFRYSTCEVLKQSFAAGNPVFEEVLRSTKSDLQLKATYVMSQEPDTGDIKAFVIVRNYADINDRLDKFEVEKVRYRKKAENEMKRQFEILQALVREYVNVYLIDPFTCDAQIIKLNNPSTIGLDGLGENDHFNYSEFYMLNVEKRGYKDDIAMIKEKMSPSYMISQLENSKEYSFAYRATENDGEVHCYQAKCLKLRTLNQVIMVIQNADNAVMLEKHQKDMLSDALKAAEKASREKTTFLFNMSHDIRTPMNAIIGFTELLDSYRGNSEKMSDCIAKIKNSCNYLLSLINNILEVARIESGKTVLDEEPVETRGFVNSVALLFESQMREKGLEFTWQVDTQHDYVYRDALKTKEILINLLSNACKYTQPGGKVRLSVEELPGDKDGTVYIQTTVSDNGIGMSREFIDHIFEEFSRERSSNDASPNGTGLGMAIVQKLVHLMGGDIRIESELGKGSVFTVRLKHRVAEAPDPDGEMISPDEASLDGRRILLAEDNDLNAEIAVAILSSAGIAVERAEDGRQCVDMLCNFPAGHYDMILMDIQMPIMDGYEATRIIRGLPDERLARIPIIAMTANAFAEDRKRAISAGMNAHVAKPVGIDTLRSVMSEILGRHGA